jgi:uncharacterized membrane protein
MSSELPSEAQAYLRQLRAGLSSLPADEQREIVDEVASHFREKLARGDRDLLAEFDAPADYAAQFVEERALSHAVATASPIALGRALLGGVGHAAETLLLVAPLAVVQLLALSLFVVGLVRPFYSAHTGVFEAPDGHIAFGVLRDVAGSRDVLGVWTAPVFITVSVLVLWSARKASLALANRRLARSRKR